MSALVAYVPDGTTRCPECGRDLIRTASGKRLCAYAEDHKSGVPIIARSADSHPEETTT